MVSWQYAKLTKPEFEFSIVLFKLPVFNPACNRFIYECADILEINGLIEVGQGLNRLS